MTVLTKIGNSQGIRIPKPSKIKFEKKDGLVLLDQIRAVDKTRFVKKLGNVDKRTSKEISKTLVTMFEP